MKYSFNSILFVFGVCILSSCGTARTIVQEPVCIPSHMSTSQVQIFRGADTVPVPADAKTTFENELSKRLFKDGLVQWGPGIRLEYRFIQYNEGSRFARYMTGGLGNAGEASLMVEMTYIGSDGTVLGKICSEGRISSGYFFGGSSDNAVEKAAEEIANYTRGVILNCNR